MGAEEGPVHLQDPLAFYTTIQIEKGRLYSLHIADLWPAFGATLCAPVPDPGISPECRDLACMFSEDEASNIPEHGLQDLEIDLYKGKQPLWKPIYNPSAKELDVLGEYLGKQLEQGRI